MVLEKLATWEKISNFSFYMKYNSGYIKYLYFKTNKNVYKFVYSLEFGNTFMTQPRNHKEEYL